MRNNRSLMNKYIPKTYYHSQLIFILFEIHPDVKSGKLLTKTQIIHEVRTSENFPPLTVYLLTEYPQSQSQRLLRSCLPVSIALKRRLWLLISYVCTSVYYESFVWKIPYLSCPECVRNYERYLHFPSIIQGFLSFTQIIVIKDAQYKSSFFWYTYTP